MDIFCLNKIVNFYLEIVLKKYTAKSTCACSLILQFTIYLISKLSKGERENVHSKLKMQE